MSKAYVADWENGSIPSTSIKLKKWECKHLDFEHYIFDGGVEDFEEKYNMVLVHPISGKIFFGYSADFNFDEVRK